MWRSVSCGWILLERVLSVDATYEMPQTSIMFFHRNLKTFQVTFSSSLLMHFFSCDSRYLICWWTFPCSKIAKDKIWMFCCDSSLWTCFFWDLSNFSTSAIDRTGTHLGRRKHGGVGPHFRGSQRVVDLWPQKWVFYLRLIAAFASITGSLWKKKTAASYEGLSTSKCATSF